MVRLGARYSNVGLDVCFGPGDLGPCSGTSSLERDWYGGVTDQKGPFAMDMSNPHVGVECGHKLCRVGAGHYHMRVSIPGADARMASCWRAIVRGNVIKTAIQTLQIECCRFRLHFWAC
jgi:hypothetical protein